VNWKPDGGGFEEGCQAVAGLSHLKMGLSELKRVVAPFPAFTCVPGLLDSLQEARVVILTDHPTGTCFLDPPGSFITGATHEDHWFANRETRLKFAGNHESLPGGIETGQVNIGGAEVRAQGAFGDIIQQLNAGLGIGGSKAFDFATPLAASTEDPSWPCGAELPGSVQEFVQPMSQTHISGIEQHQVSVPATLLPQRIRLTLTPRRKRRVAPEGETVD